MKNLIFLSLLFFSCKSKCFKYKVVCPKATYYIDTMFLDSNKLCYSNSDGKTYIISNNYGKDCVLMLNIDK